ncbi:CPBP family intramembrane glutamic endopeptidase [Nocardia suismassiliense]|uniref:CPBP family intramembrane glutamic endopeptidase n=1 Tax=Nocardia suismassiliense TaxID=2077092 RepID=UPI00131ED680|nr:type II CAAX endopeptidase family protein [Nocardia suismassiliense]
MIEQPEIHVGPASGTLLEQPVSAPSGRIFWTLVGLYVLATLLGSAAMLALQPVSGIDPPALALVQFGPALGAVVTWFSGRRIIKPLLPAPVPAKQVRANLTYVLVACLLCGLLIAGATAFAGHDLVGPAAVGGVPFVVFFVIQLVGATGEEIGWRGLLQPLLESRVRRFVAIVVTGAAWALWHVQAFGAGPVVAVSFFISAMAFAVLLGSLGTGSCRQRIVVAAVGHWLINAGIYLTAGDETLGSPQVVFIAMGAVVATAVTLAVRSWRTR